MRQCKNIDIIFDMEYKIRTKIIENCVNCIDALFNLLN